MKKYLSAIKRKLNIYNLLFPVEPVSTQFGFDRGLPIDRYYIQKFLTENKNLIKGSVLEIAEPIYTKKYGGLNVTESLVLMTENIDPAINLVANLETGEGIIDNIADCFILTQTLLCIFNIKEAAINCLRLIKPGGYLLVTVPGITQISRYDYDKWGQYWSFTEKSLLKLFDGLVSPERIKVKSYGNVKTAAAFLYGLSASELSKKTLNQVDSDYQMVITGIIQK